MFPIINIYFALYRHIGSGLWREYQTNKEHQFIQPHNGTSWKMLNGFPNTLSFVPKKKTKQKLAIRCRSKRLSSAKEQQQPWNRKCILLNALISAFGLFSLFFFRFCFGMICNFHFSQAHICGILRKFNHDLSRVQKSPHGKYTLSFLICLDC